MNKILTILQPKGGVGKTSLAHALANHAAESRPLRVLAIDTDPSGNLTTLMRQQHPNGDTPTPNQATPSFATLCQNPENPDWDSLERPAQPNPTQAHASAEIRLIPGGGGADIDKSSDLRDLLRLRKYLATLEFDLAIIDSPGYVANTMYAAIAASTHCVSPLDVSNHSIAEIPTIDEILDTINQSLRAADPIAHIGFLPFLTAPGTRAQTIFDQQINESPHASRLIPGPGIRRSAGAAAALAKGHTVWRGRKNPQTKRDGADYRETLNEILNRMKIK